MSKSISIRSALALTPTEALEKGYQVPSGTVMSFAGAIANLPAGWLHCDGSSLLKTQFQELYNKIGDVNGTADATHFNIPDLRGRFVRGWDSTAGRDPDSASRTASNTGGATGNSVGSVQADDFKSHAHNINAGNAGGGLTATNIPYNTVYAQPGVVQPTGGNETRPKNTALLYIIKY